MKGLKVLLKPHLLGLILMVAGWYISIVNVGLDRFTSTSLITNWTLLGLGMILLGAYIPEISRKFSKE